MSRPWVTQLTMRGPVLATPGGPLRFMAPTAPSAVPLAPPALSRFTLFRSRFPLRFGGRRLFRPWLRFLSFRLFRWLAFVRRLRFRLWLDRGNLRRLGRPQPRGALLRLRFPIGAPE